MTEAETAEDPGLPVIEPLGDNRGALLESHILALERLQEVKDDAAADYRARKTLAGEDGFEGPILTAILRRRKRGELLTAQWDAVLAAYEDALK